MPSFPINNALIAAESRIPMLIFENKNVMDLGADGGLLRLFLAPAMSGASHGKESFCAGASYRMRYILAGERSARVILKMGRLGRESQNIL